MKFATLKRFQPAQALDALTTAVVALDLELNVLYLNSACESLLAVRARAAVGHPFQDALPQLGALAPRLRSAFDTHTGFIDREVRLLGPGAVTVDCTVTPVSGPPPCLLLECSEIDRHSRIPRDEVLLNQHQASRELIRGLAHEIKNPLGGIRGAAQLLERDFPDSEHREYTRVIIREVDRLQDLVNRMLGPNRAPRKAAVNIHEVLEHVRQLVQAEAPERVITLRDYDPSLPEIHADREQLVQAMLNLMRNALQAVEEVDSSGMIMLRTRMRRQLTLGGTRHRLVIQIEIEDSGKGVPQEMMEKIFYPMVTTRSQGTGLGLPIAQYLVHAHGGMIECRSRPGCTIFSVYLPLEMRP